MKKIFLLLFLAAFLFAGNAHASFPVTLETEIVQNTNPIEKKQKFNTKETKLLKKESKNIFPPSAPRVDEDLLITLILLFAFGWLAAHRWYKRKPIIWNLLFIVTLGGFGFWFIADLINILTNNF